MQDGIPSVRGKILLIEPSIFELGCTADTSVVSVRQRGTLSIRGEPGTHNLAVGQLVRERGGVETARSTMRDGEGDHRDA